MYNVLVMLCTTQCNVQCNLMYNVSEWSNEVMLNAGVGSFEEDSGFSIFWLIIIICSSISGFVDIFIDRPIMKAEINVTPTLFDQVQNSFNNNSSRNIKLFIVIEENLDVNNEGVLSIKKPIHSKISDMSWVLPLR